MDFFRELNNKIFNTNLKYLVIGGYAINKYGYSRFTADIDLLIKKTDLILWQEIIGNFGYKQYFATEAFVQFSCSRQGCLPIDLMLVDDSTFEKLDKAAKSVTFGIAEAKIPSIFDLIALKLHALKQGQKHRQLKDYDDIIQIVRLNNIDSKSSEFINLCNKYGSSEIYEKIIKELS